MCNTIQCIRSHLWELVANEQGHTLESPPIASKDADVGWFEKDTAWINVSKLTSTVLPCTVCDDCILPLVFAMQLFSLSSGKNSALKRSQIIMVFDKFWCCRSSISTITEGSRGSCRCWCFGRRICGMRL